MLKTLYKKINELSNTNIISVSGEKESNEKFEKIKKDAKGNNSKDQEEANKALNSLVDKLIRKYDFEKQDELKEESDLINTKIYKNLMKKYTFINQADDEPSFQKNKSIGYNKIIQDEKINRVNIIFAFGTNI